MLATTPGHSPPPPSAQAQLPRASQRTLARQVLLKMGLRLVALTIALTALSYVRATSIVRRQSLDSVTSYTKARGEREALLFHLAESNHALVKEAYLDAIHAYGETDPVEEFDRFFGGLPDGSVRSRRGEFDGTKQAGVVVPRHIPLNPDSRRRLLAGRGVVEAYGRAFRKQFLNTWLNSFDGSGTLFWPAASNYIFEVPTDYDFSRDEYVVIATPQRDPERKTVWTKTYIDPVIKVPLVSAATPIYDGERFLGVVGHDIPLTDLVNRITYEHLEGSYNFLVNSDGVLIAHPELVQVIENSNGKFDIMKDGDAVLQSIYKAAVAVSKGSAVMQATGGDYVAATRIPGPEWLLVTVYPAALIDQAAFSTARFILLSGIISIVLELGIVYLILNRQVAAPLGLISAATRQVAAGDFSVKLETDRDDELGRLAGSFNAMACAVRDREAVQKETEETLRRNDEEIRRLNEELGKSVEKLSGAVDKLSTPVLEVWNDVLALPLIGSLDAHRSTKMTERLLAEVARTRCRFVIIDITGVDILDTSTADRLLQAVAAVELLGARCLLTGIRPAVAQTLVSLGVSFGSLGTLQTLKHGLQACIQQMNERTKM